MYYDIYYFILVVPAFLLAMAAQFWVKSAYKQYSKITNSRGITGAFAAQAILQFYGITDVSIQHISGSLTDNYNPSTKVISLSDGVYNSNSIAAVGIACHEAGHAAQHAQNYIPNQIRTALVPVCNIGSRLGIPLAIIGLIIQLTPLVQIGIGLYAFVFIFALVTLPVELNASHRALKVIEETGLLYGDEVTGARKVLWAAASTYIASMLVALANLLRFVIRFLGNSRRN